MREITVFSGSAHRALAEEMCDNLDVHLSPSRSGASATIALGTTQRELP